MRFYKRWFSKKAETREEFISLVGLGVSSISITPAIDGNFNAVLVYESRTSEGQRVVYREIITARNGGLATALAFSMIPGAVRKEAVQVCLVGEKRAEELKRRLPNATISLAFEGKAMDFEQLHREAKAQGIYA